MANDASGMRTEARMDDLRGRLKESWGVLTDDDVDRAEGQWDQMIATIREKTGESLETVTAKVNDMIDTAHEMGRPRDETR